MHVIRLFYKAFRLIGMVILGYIILFVLSKLFPFIYNLMQQIQDGVYSLVTKVFSFFSGIM